MERSFMDQLSTQLAKHFRDVHSGGNWTCVNLNDTLADVSWEQATAKVRSFNTIATLVYHIHYFVKVTLKVLQGGPLDAHDKFSFDHPPINSARDWEDLLERVRADADAFAALVEQMPEEKLWENMADAKYGSWYRNILGIIEHTHYHLGQIALIKKLLQENGGR
jgi:uncharacterized damage-inducible protein DinB